MMLAYPAAGWLAGALGWLVLSSGGLAGWCAGQPRVVLQFCGLIRWLRTALSTSALENQHENTPHPPIAPAPRNFLCMVASLLLFE
jgi:hypothetical protein